MKKMLTVLFCLFAAFCLLTGCGGKTNDPKSDNSLQKVLEAKRFVLGLDVGFPPMGFVDEKGTITGFDIDVAQEVCNRIGVTLVKQGIDWDTKEDKLNDGTIDCIWNGLSITPERSKTMNFSELERRSASSPAQRRRTLSNLPIFFPRYPSRRLKTI